MSCVPSALFRQTSQNWPLLCEPKAIWISLLSIRDQYEHLSWDPFTVTATTVYTPFIIKIWTIGSKMRRNNLHHGKYVDSDDEDDEQIGLMGNGERKQPPSDAFVDYHGGLVSLASSMLHWLT